MKKADKIFVVLSILLVITGILRILYPDIFLW